MIRHLSNARKYCQIRLIKPSLSREYKITLLDRIQSNIRGIASRQIQQKKTGKRMLSRRVRDVEGSCEIRCENSRLDDRTPRSRRLTTERPNEVSKGG